MRMIRYIIEEVFAAGDAQGRQANLQKLMEEYLRGLGERLRQTNDWE